MKKNFAKGIMAKIKEGEIKPIEKWKINLKNNLYWIVLAIMTLLSGAFLSLVILDATFFGPEMFASFKFREFFRILIFAAPYLWIFAFIVCVVSGILIFKKTKTGYRHSLLFIVSMFLLIVSVLGVSAHFSKVSERFENRFLEEGPRHPMLKLKKEERLFMPENGVLVGEITKSSKREILLKDPMKEDWEVELSNKTRINKDVELIKGKKVVIFGKKGEENNFSAIGIKRLKRPNGKRPPNGERMLEKNGMNKEIRREEMIN